MAYDNNLRRRGGGYNKSFELRPEFQNIRDLQQQEPDYDIGSVLDYVKSFVVYLYRYIREKNVYKILEMYKISFQKLSKRMFKQSPWPVVEAIAPYVDNDHVFCLLYRELWFRHAYARLSPTLALRMESWDNYCSLFQIILHGNINMQLPNQWLWDMIDEFSIGPS
ncbi:hypothetical protein L7F22_000281 [Adiantum nelumboides]|nr:hypothetical protein [Adiantum nelumboides]